MSAQSVSKGDVVTIPDVPGAFRVVGVSANGELAQVRPLQPALLLPISRLTKVEDRP